MCRGACFWEKRGAVTRWIVPSFLRRKTVIRRGACFWEKRGAVMWWIVPFGTGKSMGSGRGRLFGTSQKAVCTVWRRLCDMEKGLHLPPHRRDRRCIDSLAQQVEHIPFKDGVLGSSPRRITGVQMNKKAKAFHSWTDPQWRAFFRVFSFMSSFSCLDARKGSEKKIKASAEAGEVWPGIRQTWLASLTPPEG